MSRVFSSSLLIDSLFLKREVYVELVSGDGGAVEVEGSAEGNVSYGGVGDGDSGIS